MVTQRAGSVAGCGLQRVQQIFYFRKKILCVAGDNGGVEWKSFVFRPVQLGRIITLQMNILEYNFSHET